MTEILMFYGRRKSREHNLFLLAIWHAANIKKNFSSNTFWWQHFFAVYSWKLKARESGNYFRLLLDLNENWHTTGNCVTFSCIWIYHVFGELFCAHVMTGWKRGRSFKGKKVFGDIGNHAACNHIINSNVNEVLRQAHS